MNRREFDEESDDAVYTHYAESMSLAIFLMQGQQNHYRAGFLDYVRDAYRGRLRPGGSGQTLSERLGVPYETLDRQFQDFLKAGSSASEPHD